MQPKLTELIVASFSFKEHDPLYLKILMLNAAMFITMLISLFLFLINLFVVENNPLAVIDLLIAATMILSLYLLRYKRNHVTAGYIAVIALFVLHILIIYTQKGDHFTLIWSYFFSPFAMITLGSKHGLYISIPFLSIIFLMSFFGIGVWDHGYWDLLGCFHFTLSHLAMLYIMYVIFDSNQKAIENVEALCSHRKNQLKHYEKLSLTDPLTNLHNRRSLNELLPRYSRYANEHKKHFAFFLLDIDHFKSYNDTYGHQKGDTLLIEIAKILEEELNDPDGSAFRLGGDEFGGMIVADNEKEIELKIQHIQEQITQSHFSHIANPTILFVTVSIGVYVPLGEVNDFREVYETTDHALYRAKTQGRNRTVFISQKLS